MATNLQAKGLKPIWIIGLCLALTACITAEPSRYVVKDGQVYWATDQDYSDFGGFALEPIEADARTFRRIRGLDNGVGPLTRAGLAVDKDHVFFLGEIIPNADPKTFSTIEDPANEYGDFFADSERVWFRDRELEDVNPNNFDVLSGRKGKTPTQCFYEAKPVEMYLCD